MTAPAASPTSLFDAARRPEDTVDDLDLDLTSDPIARNHRKLQRIIYSAIDDQETRQLAETGRSSFQRLFGDQRRENSAGASNWRQLAGYRDSGEAGAATAAVPGIAPVAAGNAADPIEEQRWMQQGDRLAMRDAAIARERAAGENFGTYFSEEPDSEDPALHAGVVRSGMSARAAANAAQRRAAAANPGSSDWDLGVTGDGKLKLGPIVLGGNDSDSDAGVVERHIQERLGDGTLARIASGLAVTALDLTTPLFIRDGVAAVRKALAAGDYLEAAVQAAGIGLSLVPVAGKGFKLLIKPGGRAAKAIEESVGGLRAGEVAGAPPQLPQRAFGQDYPHLTGLKPGDALPVDMEGNPLVGRYIIGRQTFGGADVPVPNEAFEPMIKRIIRNLEIPYDYGRQPDMGINKISRVPMLDGEYGEISQKHKALRINENLVGQDAIDTLAHEFGHLVHLIAGNQWIRENADSRLTINTIRREGGMTGQLTYIYNDLNNPGLVQARREAAERGLPPLSAKEIANHGEFLPEHNKYDYAQAVHELWAEAVRAYAQNPSYVKTVAPDVAAAIRSAWNKDPERRKIVQFNSAAPIGAVGGAAAAGSIINGDSGRQGDDRL